MPSLCTCTPGEPGDSTGLSFMDPNARSIHDQPGTTYGPPQSSRGSPDPERRARGKPRAQQSVVKSQNQAQRTKVSSKVSHLPPEPPAESQEGHWPRRRREPVCSREALLGPVSPHTGSSGLLQAPQVPPASVRNFLWAPTHAPSLRASSTLSANAGCLGEGGGACATPSSVEAAPGSMLRGHPAMSLLWDFFNI